jgi:hypothetical protein
LVCRQGFVESRGMTPPCRRNILRLVLGYWRLLTWERDQQTGLKVCWWAELLPPAYPVCAYPITSKPYTE